MGKVVPVPPCPTSASSHVRDEKRRFLTTLEQEQADGILFSASGIAEVVPEPTPATLSLLHEAWAPGGAVARAYAALGLPYDAEVPARELLVTVMGRLYANARLERRLLRRRSALDCARIACAAWMKGLTARQALLDFEPRFLEPLRAHVREVTARDAGGLSDDALFALARGSVSRLAGEHFSWDYRIGILLDLLGREVEGDLTRAGFDYADALRLPADALPRASSAEDFLERFGHRAVQDLELACPRFRELGVDAVPFSGALSAPAPAPRLPAGLATRVDLLRQLLVLKERVKDALCHSVGAVRSLILEIGRRGGLDDDVFFLTLPEIWSLQAGPAPALLQVASERRTRHAALLAVPLPRELRLVDIERLGIPAAPQAGGDLRGVRVCGGETVEGTALVLHEATPAGQAIPPGTILVSRNASPALSRHFPLAAGLVTGGGGMLSHLAILAREMGVPYVAGCAGVDGIRSGDHLSLHGDGSVTVLGPLRTLGVEVTRGEAGGKAERLSLLAARGLPVPPGFVATAAFLEAHSLGVDDVSGLSLLAGAASQLGGECFIVRSSGSVEDGGERSYAGLFESVASVLLAEIPAAVREVRSSYAAALPSGYHSGQAVEGGVIVQQMLTPTLRGVLFTVDPKDECRMALEVYPGEGYLDELAPLRLHLGRRSGQLLDAPLQELVDSVQLERLFDMACEVEAIFGAPQDIEWACEGDRVHLLQARDISA